MHLIKSGGVLALQMGIGDLLHLKLKGGVERYYYRTLAYSRLTGEEADPPFTILPQPLCRGWVQRAHTYHPIACGRIYLLISGDSLKLLLRVEVHLVDYYCYRDLIGLAGYQEPVYELLLNLWEVYGNYKIGHIYVGSNYVGLSAKVGCPANNAVAPWQYPCNGGITACRVLLIFYNIPYGKRIGALLLLYS